MIFSIGVHPFIPPPPPSPPHIPKGTHGGNREDVSQEDGEGQEGKTIERSLPSSAKGDG